LGVEKRNGKNIIIKFTNCTVTLNNEILFKPEWGTYDMACGSKVVSVFGGASDRMSYLSETGGYVQAPRFPRTNETIQNKKLIPMYEDVRRIREMGEIEESEISKLKSIHKSLDQNFKEDWLLRLEILELVNEKDENFAQTLKSQLKEFQKDKTLNSLISRGLEII
jgi:phenylalanine-4-hydroxylase